MRGKSPLSGPDTSEISSTSQASEVPTDAEEQVEQAAAKNLGFQESVAEGSLDQKYQQLSQTFNKKLEGLDKSDSQWLREKYEQLNKDKDRAAKLYEQARNRAEWAEVANTLAQAFVKLGAAYEGARTGMNISSGVPFQKQDWSNTYNRLLQDYRMKLDNLENNLKQEKDIRAADTRTGREGIRREYQAAIKDIVAARAEQERKKREILKGAKTEEKAQENLEKERAKRDAGYEKVKGLVRDLDEGRLKENKAIPKIRNELVKLGHKDADFQKALTEADDASFRQ